VNITLDLARRPLSSMSKIVGLEFTPLSKPFKTREQAEKAREKYPERLRKTSGLGVVWIET